MQSTRAVAMHDPPYGPDERAPGEDDLPSSDGMPMETQRHVLQMFLLIETLVAHWRAQERGFIGGDMFVYFSPTQQRSHDFRGPDVFVARNATKRERKSWIVWQEDGPPDMVIELLSESTAKTDRVLKKQIYQDRMRVPEYVWFDPYSEERAGFVLRDGVYQPMRLDGRDRLLSDKLDLALVRWQGEYCEVEATWLRWETLDGVLLPTGAESRAEAEARLVGQFRRLAEQDQMLEGQARRIAELEARLAARGGENGANDAR